MQNGLKLSSDAIRKAKRIVISGHMNPDGDSIGSLLSLGLGLEKLDKHVYMISWDSIPHRYRNLPGASRIMKKMPGRADLAIAVDCSNREILGRNYDSFITADKILEIDHHAFRRQFGDVSFTDSKAACVGELVYRLLSHLGIVVTKDIAQNLMTSIIVETNSFRLPNVTPLTFEVCTKLIRSGLDYYKLVDTVFWSKGRESTVLTGVCLARCRFLKNGRLAWSIIRKGDFNRTGGRDEDVDAVPDEMRDIKGVDLALLFREKDRKILRVSLRSKGEVNAASLAERFGGGGHFDVAGCNIANSKRSIRNFLSLAELLLDDGELSKEEPK